VLEAIRMLGYLKHTARPTKQCIHPEEKRISVNSSEFLTERNREVNSITFMFFMGYGKIEHYDQFAASWAVV
jgi:hypothetical protein